MFLYLGFEIVRISKNIVKTCGMRTYAARTCARTMNGLHQVHTIEYASDLQLAWSTHAQKCPRVKFEIIYDSQARRCEQDCMFFIRASETYVGRTSDGIYTTQLDRSADILYVNTVSRCCKGTTIILSRETTYMGHTTSADSG